MILTQIKLGGMPMIQKVGMMLAGAFLAILGMAVVAQAQTVRGEGRYVSNALTHLTPFKAIEIHGDAQVDVWQTDGQNVTISGKSNLVELADIRVENETLMIGFKRPVHIKGAHALHVTVGTNRLETITAKERARVRVRGVFDMPQLIVTASDHAYVTGNQIQGDHLRVQAMNKAEVDLDRMQVKKLEAGLFDKAEVELSGAATTAQLINNGSGDLEADGLRVAQAHVQINGSGDVDLFATDTLKAEALGRGEIIYHGNPVLTRSGNLKLIKAAFED